MTSLSSRSRLVVAGVLLSIGALLFTEPAQAELIRFQGFEGGAGDTWTTVIANCVTNIQGSGDLPANQRIRTGSYSWQPGYSVSVNETLELGTVDVSTYSEVVATLRLSATTDDPGAGFGMYPSDILEVYVAVDGGDYPSSPDIRLTGNILEQGGIQGVLWGYSATGIAGTTAGVVRVFAPATGGLISDGFATVQVALPPGTASVKMKVVSTLEYYGYYWNVDDIALNGIADGGATDYPPTLGMNPPGNKNTAVNAALTFDITGTEIPNDAGDTITLWATNLPQGGVYPQVSGSSVLTNTFSWTPLVTGTTVVSFFAGDKDGTNRLDVTIRVFEHAAAGTYRAVICGISDYEGSANDLDYCDDDAQDLYNLLVSSSNWVAGNIQLLLNSQCTEANIRAAIVAMGAASAPGDVNLFYFSGHGGGDLLDVDGDEGDGYDEYMCPYNITTQEISDDELAAWLDALPTDNIIVLLDTCHSGGHLKGSPGRRIKGYSRTGLKVDAVNGFADDLRRKGRRDANDLLSPYISTAADDDEYSYEDDALQHGVYTYYLLEALTNGDSNEDGWFAGEETFDYLYPLVVSFESTQHPQEYDGWPGLANIVTWDAPVVDGPDITGFSVPAGATAAARVTSVLGQDYALQYTTNLKANPVEWTEADTGAGTGGEIILEDSTPSDDMRFYRVIILP